MDIQEDRAGVDYLHHWPHHLPPHLVATEVTGIPVSDPTNPTKYIAQEVGMTSRRTV